MASTAARSVALHHAQFSLDADPVNAFLRLVHMLHQASASQRRIHINYQAIATDAFAGVPLQAPSNLRLQKFTRLTCGDVSSSRSTQWVHAKCRQRTWYDSSCSLACASKLHDVKSRPPMLYESMRCSAIVET
jgi:hypothetical protein